MEKGKKEITLEKQEINRTVNEVLEGLKNTLGLDMLSDIPMPINQKRICLMLSKKPVDSYRLEVWGKIVSYIFSRKIIVENEYDLVNILKNGEEEL